MTRPAGRSAYSPGASSQPLGCWCRTWSPQVLADRGANGTAGWHCQLLGQWAASGRPFSLPQPSPGLRGRTHGRAWARPRGVPESPSSAAPHRRRLLAERCPQPCRPARLRRRRLGSPPGGQVPPAAAGPGHGGRHLAELARSFSDACPGCPDSPTPLAESPTIPSAAPTRQPHFRAPDPAPARTNPEASRWRGGAESGAWTSSSWGARTPPPASTQVAAQLRRRILLPFPWLVTWTEFGMLLGVSLCMSVSPSLLL